MRLRRTATYRADLERIVDYIASENPRAALAIWDEIETQVERLAAYPHSGRLGRIEGTRELVVNRTPLSSATA
jgi:toxin ParE1/3/4